MKTRMIDGTGGSRVNQVAVTVTRRMGLTATLRPFINFFVVTFISLLLQSQPIGAVPFSGTVPTFQQDVVTTSHWYLNASLLSITTINDTDLAIYYAQCQAAACTQITIDLSYNQLDQLPVNLFQSQSIYQTILLSHNLFTSAAIEIFFPADAVTPTVFSGPAARWAFSLDLSYNQIGPVPPTVSQFINADKFVCQHCGLTSLPSASFDGAQINSLDLSSNDFSAPGSIAPLVFAGLTTNSIILNNCNLRTHSLPPNGLLYNISPFDSSVPFVLSFANQPMNNAGVLTSNLYLATWPNIFVDLPDGVFSTPPVSLGFTQVQVGSIAIGDFVSYAGVEGLFGNATLANPSAITINLAPSVALDIIGAVSNYCPVQQAARALTNCQQTSAGILYHLGAYGLNASAQLVPNTPECTFPVVSPSCHASSTGAVVSTEPALLQRPFYKWLNSIVVPSQNYILRWIAPTGSNWNPSLNRSDWMPQDMLCDLTNFAFLALPALPYPQFAFPPPEDMLACLTATTYYIDWRSASLVCTGLFDGRRSNAPQLSVLVDLLRLYEGDRPVPLDFFTPLIGHLVSLLNSVASQFSQDIICSVAECSHAATWLASRCP